MKWLNVAQEDVKAMFKNPFIRVSVVAIIVVPLLYSLLYLAAFWDPYSRLSSLPVAVVNEDEGYEDNGKIVNYGNELVDRLKEDDTIGWQFVTLDEGEKGLKDKDGYYAMFVVPKDFSSNAISAKERKPVKAQILYSSNEKKNFLASQINGRVMLELKEQVTKNITENYTKVVFDNMEELKDGMNKARDGSKDIADGNNKLKDKMPQLENGVGDLYDGSKALANGIGTLALKIPSLSSGVDRLSSGSKELENGLGDASIGAGKAYRGSLELNNGIRAFKSQGLVPINQGLLDLGNGFKTKIIPNVDKLSQGATALSNGLSLASSSVSKLQQGSDKLDIASQKLNGGALAIDGGAKKVGPAINTLTDGATAVSLGVNEAAKTMEKSQSQLKNSVDTQLKAYLQANPEAMKDPNMQGFLKSLADMEQEAKNNSGKIAALKEGAANEAAGLNKFRSESGSLVKGINDFAIGSTEFSNGAKEFTLGATALSKGMAGAIQGSKDLSDGLMTLDQGLKNQIVPSIDKLQMGTAALQGKCDDLIAGSDRLTNSLGGTTSSDMTLERALQKLYGGSSTLRMGLGTLNEKVPELTAGTSKLENGSEQLAMGMSDLKANIPELKDGVTKLADGSGELNSKLGEGADKINNNLVNTSSDMSEFISEPIIMDENPTNPVKDYGTGFAPYFIPLSLWVGAIMMFFVITDKVDDDMNVSASAVVLGKFFSYGFIGIIQALLAGVIVLTLGLKPANLPLYLLFNVLLSFVFIAIIQSLIYLLGQVGRLLSIVLLILQLTSCAGTFPLQVVPKFFKVLNPWMPFTYAVSGLREVISGVDYVVLRKDVLILLFIMILFLFISIVMKDRADKLHSKIQEKKEEVMATN